MRTVTIADMTLVRRTERLALFITDDGREAWFLLSQVDCTAWDEGDCGDLEVPLWLADAKGLRSMTRAEQKRSVFVDFAKGLASLSTCERRQVGCIITDLNEVYAIGYNGAPRGLLNSCCGPPGLCGCVHAEANAIAKLSSKEPNLWLHSTLSPCVLCAGLIINRGNISTVTYSARYRDPAGLILLKDAGINVDRYHS